MHVVILFTECVSLQDLARFIVQIVNNKFAHHMLLDISTRLGASLKRTMSSLGIFA